MPSIPATIKNIFYGGCLGPFDWAECRCMEETDEVGDGAGVMRIFEDECIWLGVGTVNRFKVASSQSGGFVASAH